MTLFLWHKCYLIKNKRPEGINALLYALKKKKVYNPQTLNAYQSPKEMFLSFNLLRQWTLSISTNDKIGC